MQIDAVTKGLINKLSHQFPDFKGLYHYGSQISKNSRIDSDYDYVLIFENIDYEKELEIAGIISNVEYGEHVEIDYKIFTVKGKKSIEHIRKEVNPVFVDKAIDNGIYYGRT